MINGGTFQVQGSYAWIFYDFQNVLLISEVTEIKMASSDRHFCRICKDDELTKIADRMCRIVWRKLWKTSQKGHKTISIVDYQKLPTFIKEISIQCKDNKKMFELYCSFHAWPCCVQCVTDKHLKCQDMKPFSDVLKQVKSSASV